MTGPGVDGRRRRWWPRGIRARLTLIYTSLFLVGGAVLLGLTFGLVAHSLNSGTGTVQPRQAPSQALLKECKQEVTTQHTAAKGATSQAKQVPVVNPKCKKAFLAGAAVGTSDQRSHTMHELEVWSLLGLGLLTLLSAGLGWLMAGRVLRPVRDITDAARRASEEHLGERINLAGPEDELKELADTFDAMLDRLDLAFAAQRQFVANASHELRTPLTSMRTAIDVVLAKPTRTSAQLEATAEKVRRSLERAEHIIDALLTLAVSNQGAEQRDVVDLATAAEDALDAVAERARAAGVTVESELRWAEVTGNRVLLERLVANLVENAVVHNVDAGWVRVRTGVEGAGAVLEVANSGPVVPAEVLPHLFEPFRRGQGRAGSSGVGLGLSIVRSVADAHGATVSASPGAEGGLTVTVTLTRRVEPARPGAGSVAGPDAAEAAEAATDVDGVADDELETVPGVPDGGAIAAGPAGGGPAAGS
jgi:signal transduction histidine kinase